MKIIPRYLGQTIITTILIILLILMGLELLISFIGELGRIGKGHYDVWHALKFIALDMPYQVYVFFPMASLVGSLLGLGALANQSELIVMRSAGFSNGQIIWSVIKASFVIVIIAVILGEVIAPYTQHQAKIIRTVAISGTAALNTNQGMWIRETNSFVHINRVVSKYHIQDIKSYTFTKQHQLAKAMIARDAYYQDGQWILKKVNLSSLHNNRVSSRTVPQMQWKVNLAPDLLSIANTEPRDMSLFKLHDYINYLKDNGLHAASYQLNFWKRILEPLATAVMIFLAIPFVFGSFRSITMGVRILTGIVLGFCFYILNQFFGPLSLMLQMPPILGAALPMLLFMGAGFILLWRAR